MQSDRLRVRPARAGLVVVDPDTRNAIPAEGTEVPRSAYWIRRLQQGDVVEIQEPQPAAVTE